MSDWRSQPRTGNSQFTPHLPEIRSRLAQGETYKQIHMDLTERGLLKIGYAQFAKYVKRSINPIKTPISSRITGPTIPTTPPLEKVAQSERKPVTRAELRNLRNEEEDWEALNEG